MQAKATDELLGIALDTMVRDNSSSPVIRPSMKIGNSDDLKAIFLYSINDAVRKAIHQTPPRVP
jgi:hypothetical protein